MGCNCIPPPPIFDLPPPPDPSLIWDLISDEPFESFQKVRLKSCEFNPLFNVFDQSIEFGNFSNEPFLYLLIFIFTVILTACICATCLLRIRRCRQRRATSSMNSSKFNSSSDTVITGHVTPWPYNSMKPVQNPFEDMNDALRAMPIAIQRHGSKSTSNIVAVTSSPRSMPTATLIRTTPKRVLSQNFTTRLTAIRIPPEAYYTVGHYEEISEVYPQVHSPVSDNIFEDLGQNLRHLDAIAYQSQRRPPPTCRPPPPPPPPRLTTSPQFHSPGSGKIETNFGPLSPEFQDDLSSATEPELEKIHQQEELRSLEPKSRLGEVCGRESGYGTGTSRLWNSPKVGKSDDKSPSTSMETTPPSSSNSSNSKSSLPLKIYAQEPVQSMTYV